MAYTRLERGEVKMYLQIENLDFKYKNSKDYLLEDFNFTAKEGEIVCLLGESGSGKSTVLRLISGLERADRGSISINSKKLAAKNIFVAPENRGVGMLFQDYALFPHLTIKDNILFGISQKSKSYKRKKLEELLNLVGLNDLKDRYSYQLSGGQQQRVALARALAIDPKLILLDEPFSNLDTNLQSRIRGELKKIIKGAGVTAVLVSHDKDDAIDIADKVVVLQGGQIIQEGEINEVINNPNSKYVMNLFK